MQISELLKTPVVRRHRCNSCHEIFDCEDCTRAMHADFKAKIPHGILYSFLGATEADRENLTLDNHFVCARCKAA
jgi:hypothetical protein